MRTAPVQLGFGKGDLEPFMEQTLRQTHAIWKSGKQE